MAILKLAQFQCSLNKSEKSDQPLGQLALVSPMVKNDLQKITAQNAMSHPAPVPNSPGLPQLSVFHQIPFFLLCKVHQFLQPRALF
jgi:hypothetical protein